MADWKKAAEVLAMALRAIDLVIKRFSKDRSLDKAGDLLTILGALVESVNRGDLEKLDSALAEEELQRLIDALDENDAAADQALKDKFDDS